MPVRMMIGGDLLSPGETEAPLPDVFLRPEYQQYGIWEKWDGERSSVTDVLTKIDCLLDKACSEHNLSMRGVKYIGKKPTETDSGYIAAKMWAVKRGENNNG